MYHVLNRANARAQLFASLRDYEAFEDVLAEAYARTPLRILAYCVMPNHWHFVVWPQLGEDSQVSDFFRWLANTHGQRWRRFNGTIGEGHVYQGRFKAFPVQEDDHLLNVNRYVERNALSAGLVSEAQRWRFSSLWRRTEGSAASRMLLASWPIPVPEDWVGIVNRPCTAHELERVRASIARGTPLGSPSWVARTAEQLGLQATLRPPGRPPRTEATVMANAA